MTDRIFHVDTLTSRPFHGNPVSVCILEKPRARPWMRDVSLELGTPETAFLLPRSPNRFDLRTMAGAEEVEMAATATLAAAHVLFTESFASRSFADPRRPIAFLIHSGSIPATLEGVGLEINFPALYMEELSDPPEEILQAVDAAPEFVGRRGDDYFVQVSSEERLREVRPDFKFLRTMGMRGLIVTSIANVTASHNFVARTFYIPTPHEDPIASYAHCLLGPFWFLRLGKTVLTGVSDSARLLRSRNPTAFRLAIDGDRVKVTGEAVTVFEGELKI